MDLLHELAAHPIAWGVSAVALFAISLLIRRPEGRRWTLVLSLFLYGRYMAWRVLYTIPTDDFASMFAGIVVYLAELYGLFQFCFFTYQSWSPYERRSVPPKEFPTVDIMVTVVDEPLQILRQTLIGSLAQDYPKDRVLVHVLDDGHRDDVKALAQSLGCHYLRRPDRPRHAKAGNLNHALPLTRGELIAVFDVDHVPARTFLKETVGFFEDSKVAIVQTPHHFYNPDVFQRNLGVAEVVSNEQALFFRSLQAGRDAHNSAFFAGSGGLFRRRPLMEIGGFQTQTITEDIHTSMNLHARGYRSCYLNRVLSAGLMPETFEGYLKQRKRWAMGCIQMLLKDNPLTKRGLSWPQRIDYFGSVFYFFFGIPRLICLLAPLASLLFATPPVKANIWELSNYFFAFLIASALIMRPISRGSRNPFWSDIYEIAMCFALTSVAVKAVSAPRKERPFEVTPKGQRVQRHASSVFAYAWPHLTAFGLLILGLVYGTIRFRQDPGENGLLLSLWWAGVNLIFLTVAMFVAGEQAQSRHRFRLRRDFASALFIDGDSHSARIVNISEEGVGLLLERAILSTQPYATLALTSAEGRLLKVDGRLVRQDRTPDGTIEAGFEFLHVSDPIRQQLIDKMFGDPDNWEKARPVQVASGIGSSLGSMVRALAAPWRGTEAELRWIPRIEAELPCRFRTGKDSYLGRVKDMSYAGISVVLRTKQQVLADGWLDLPKVTLRVAPVSVECTPLTAIVRFRVECIERGESQWRDVHESYWQHAS